VSTTRFISRAVSNRSGSTYTRAAKATGSTTIQAPPCELPAKIPSVVRKQRSRLPAVQSFPRAYRCKSNAIKSHNPVVASQPHITVWRLRQRVNRALWQTLLLLPRAKAQRHPGLVKKICARLRAANICEIAERCRDGHVAEIPTAARASELEQRVLRIRRLPIVR
jgi:hypothetical protein